MQCLVDPSSYSLSSAAAVSAMRCRAWRASTCEIRRGALVRQHGQGLRLAKYGELVAAPRRIDEGVPLTASSNGEGHVDPFADNGLAVHAMSALTLLLHRQQTGRRHARARVLAGRELGRTK